MDRNWTRKLQIGLAYWIIFRAFLNRYFGQVVTLQENSECISSLKHVANTVTIQLWIKSGISASFMDSYEVVNTNFASFSAKFKIVTNNYVQLTWRIMDEETKQYYVKFNMISIFYPNFKLIKLVQCMACELFIKNTCFVFFNYRNKCLVHMELSNSEELIGVCWGGVGDEAWTTVYVHSTLGKQLQRTWPSHPYAHQGAPAQEWPSSWNS